MPIYEYLCRNCAHRFEVKQGMKDDPIKSCSRCGQEVTRLISSPAIMFKGSGWYVTDYSDKLKPTEGSEGSEKATDKAEEGKKKSEPATTAATPPVSSSSGESRLDTIDVPNPIRRQDTSDAHLRHKQSRPRFSSCCSSIELRHEASVARGLVHTACRGCV